MKVPQKIFVKSGTPGLSEKCTGQNFENDNLKNLTINIRKK